MRPSWDLYFAALSFMAAARSTCDRAWVGAVLVGPDKHVLATGFNGAKRGEPHCDEVGHELVDGHCVRTVHAERNAIMQARYRADSGEALAGSTIFVTHRPCIACSKLICASGVTRVVYVIPYDDGQNVAFLDSSGLEVCKLGLADVFQAINWHVWRIVNRFLKEPVAT